MALGSGKYDAACTAAREATGAIATVLIVVGGRDGSGFSMQAPPEFAAKLPALLRTLADGIEHDLAG